MGLRAGWRCCQWRPEAVLGVGEERGLRERAWRRRSSELWKASVERRTKDTEGWYENSGDGTHKPLYVKRAQYQEAVDKHRASVLS